MTKCKVCGNEHSGSCASFFAEQSSRAIPKKSTTQEVANEVVDTARQRGAAVVDARARDRHRKTEERREYLKMAQRRSRAARRASQ